MCHMTFKVGDTVVYPHHGAARIEEIETRSIKGQDKTYLVLKVDKGDLTVRVPADNAELSRCSGGAPAPRSRSTPRRGSSRAAPPTPPR